MKHLTIAFTTSYTGYFVITDDEKKISRNANFEVSINQKNENLIWINFKDEICPKILTKIKLFNPNGPKKEIEKYLQVRYL